MSRAFHTARARGAANVTTRPRASEIAALGAPPMAVVLMTRRRQPWRAQFAAVVRAWWDAGRVDSDAPVRPLLARSRTSAGRRCELTRSLQVPAAPSRGRNPSTSHRRGRTPDEMRARAVSTAPRRQMADVPAEPRRHMLVPRSARHVRRVEQDWYRLTCPALVDILEKLDRPGTEGDDAQFLGDVHASTKVLPRNWRNDG